jgi:hypothetical protein
MIIKPCTINFKKKEEEEGDNILREGHRTIPYQDSMNLNL